MFGDPSKHSDLEGGEEESSKRRKRHDTDDSSDKDSEAAKYVLDKYFVVYQAL